MLRFAEAAGALGPHFAEAGLTLRTALTPVTVEGDPARLRQVVDGGIQEIDATPPVCISADESCDKGPDPSDEYDLIEKLDQRRPQVYIEAKILAVTNTEDFRLAVESQLIAGQFAANTNFGLGTFGEDSFDSRKSVATGLGGFTSALIKSQYVPFIINAIQRNTDGRILSSPQLLVNDNQEASIVSLEQQPTTTTTTGQTTDQVTFADFVSAGTTLRVTPGISEAGYLRLAYYIEQSNFVGSSAAPGIPPPRQERTVESEAVTIPTDTTIVVGGITVSDRRKTVVKVPLLGDLGGDALTRLAEKVEMKEIRRRQVLYLPGDPGAAVYFVNGGRVKVSKVTRDGKELTLAYRGPGEVFGEACLVDGGPREEMAEAMENALVTEIERSEFERLLQTQPILGYRLAKVLVPFTTMVPLEGVQSLRGHRIGLRRLDEGGCLLQRCEGRIEPRVMCMDQCDAEAGSQSKRCHQHDCGT